MGDYDEDGSYNPQLAGETPEPLPTTEDIERDNYSTDQVARMHQRIAQLGEELAALKAENKYMREYLTHLARGTPTPHTPSSILSALVKEVEDE
jgi:uncharacterized small protein (DUF1192 family)